MKFSVAAPIAAVAAVLALSAPAAAAPVESQTLRVRACPKSNGILTAVDGLLETLVPELKPLNDGISGLEAALGKNIPAVGTLLSLLDSLCV